MNKKILFYISSVTVVIAFIALQTVLFPMFFKNLYMPDLSLIAIIYFSINYGKNIGQIMGFSTGLLLDTLSGFPFGLHALIRVVMGYLLGFFNGVIFLDKILLPCIMITVCSILKYLFIFLVILIFPINRDFDFLTLKNGIELIMNIVLTPFIFALFNLLAKRLYPKRDVV